MPNRAVFDTRFFIELFYQKNQSKLNQLKDELRHTHDRFVSVVTVYETHRINQSREGKTVANLRSDTINRGFTVVPLDYTSSIQAAEIAEKHRTPLADSVIAAISLSLNASVVTDDPHFQSIIGVKTRWPIRKTT